LTKESGDEMKQTTCTNLCQHFWT